MFNDLFYCWQFLWKKDPKNVYAFLFSYTQFNHSSFLFFLYNLGHVITHLTGQLFCCVLNKIILWGANSFSGLMKFSTLTESKYVSHCWQVSLYPAIDTSVQPALSQSMNKIRFSTTTTLKLFLMLRTYLTSHQTIFGCFQHWRTLFVVAHFQVVPLLQQRFSSGHNEPLKKLLLRPCNRSDSVVKNVYVYRVITLRNDCVFSFLGWVIF